MRILFYLVGTMLCVTGCRGPGFGNPDFMEPQPVQHSCQFQPYAEQEHAAYHTKGTARIYGEAFLVTRGGQTKLAKGETVYLLPDTGYGLEYSWRLTGVQQCDGFNPRFLDSVRQVKADSHGQFVFEKLPAGSYLLLVRIEWELPRNPYKRYQSPEYSGGDVTEHVILEAGEDKRVILTR